MDGAINAVLIIIIFILIFWLYNSNIEKTKAQQQWLCMEKNTGQLKSVEMKESSPGNSQSYEGMAKKAMKENAEYFAVCNDQGEVNKVLDCVCDANDPLNFAVWDYGAAGMSYQDYVASQAVDNKVITNHAQFVRDRKGLGPEGEFITGRTYSPDSHDSYDPIPWVGLQRPRYVQQCNPTQVPDVDTNLYKGNRAYCLWS